MTTPLISDATLAKIVRLAYLAPDLGSIIREDMLSCVVDGELATAIEMARGECHPVNYGGQLIAALEEANEEAARNAKRPTQWSDGAEMRRNDALHAAGLALADSTDAARERLKHAIRVVLGRYEGESMGKLADAASAFFGEDFS